MTWEYCEQWSNLLEEPMAPMSAAQAAQRHAAGKLYTAVQSSGGNGSPLLRVEVRLETGYVSVIFMDQRGRDELSCTFSVVGNRLFLQAVTFYSYGDSEECGGYAVVESLETYEFQQGGVVCRTLDEAGERHRESRSGIDVSGQWENLPDFVEYDFLIRRERS
ncbi:hypothetical protein [Streptomyces xinghaiensis]|uniref:hypothetical protein n=1 Tax=Streptomyces xinghaiensis TaxID=1038928 RepID=UPI002E0F574F|nr:hypothetical protein OG463_24625 [Streptomyces xinghaiensis]